MTYDLVSRIEKRLAALGMSAAATSAQAGLSKDAIRNIQRAVSAGKTTGVSTKTLTALAKVLQTTPAWLLTGTGAEQAYVPVAGKIIMGGIVRSLELQEDNLSNAPPEVAENTQSLVVDGGSMLPAYEPGSTIYFSERLEPERCINRRCVAKVEEGPIVVCVLRASDRPGLWLLQSINPSAEDTNVRLEWAAKIDWVRPPD
jgi:transcriptional regulator with XRE-family HTH domain